MQFRAPNGSSLRRIGRLAVVGVALAVCACGGAVNTVRAVPQATTGSVFERQTLLTASDYAALRKGDTITRPMVVERGDHRYVGGVAYQLIEAPADVIYAALHDGQAIERILPKTKHVNVLWRRGNVWQAEVRQGNRWLDVDYTVVFREAPPQAAGADAGVTREVNFWLEPALPHDIDDLWGFFAVQQLDPERSLVSIGALVDLGSGFGRLFENHVQKLILSTPRNIDRYFQKVRLARVEANR